ncbi:sucrose-6-phosphate hydrolase [Caerostris darwini]|uniref:Sucrose-6-phosphate hydrolase n=1 Tax=Caerostris darwini TaxID=1538125 RepID=A0AAV4P8Q3_9ARAC|nr:sucrose-6-phosphate hydrolase [Caerostris darwini]
MYFRIIFSLFFICLLHCSLGAKLQSDGQHLRLKKSAVQSSDTPETLFQTQDQTSETVSAFEDPQAEDECNASVPEKEAWYPTYHLAPPQGWMNDPNGLIEFEDYFHAFFQYNPSAPFWGDIHWGHARSKNLIQWEHLPVALAPSIPEDRDGVFSGSAVNDNGVLTAIYTGNNFLENDQLRQVTCLATSNDTINFTKLGEVLEPPNGVQNFRDPKAWWGDDRWYVVMGTQDGAVGEAHLYESEDLHHWDFVEVLATGAGGLGYMWECPDFFPLDDKYLLVLSPQGIEPEGYKYRNIYQSGYFVGTWEHGSAYHIEKNFTEIDNGHDFYAPQTFLTSDQRRIVIGWMSMWESPFPEKAQGWSGMLSLPRELVLAKDGNVLIEPVREIEAFRGPENHLNKTVLEKSSHILSRNVKAMEILMSWDLSSSNAEKYGLRLGDENCSDGGLYIYIDTQAQTLTLDRRYARYSVSGYRSIPLLQEDQISLRVFLDHSSVEVFVDGGRNCMSSRIYPADDQRQLSIFADNGIGVLEKCSWWPIVVKEVK